jgi:hypothetical protein
VKLTIILTSLDSWVAADNAMPCRVAFERGKERLVHLLVVLQGTTGSLLLVEDIPFKQKRGMIRVTAPLAGSDVHIPSYTYISSGL